MSDFSKQIIVIQRSDGKFFHSGGDEPDYWVSNPLDADDRSWLLYEHDQLYNGMLGPDCKLVKFTIIAIFNDISEKIWEALKNQCAATPDKSKVKNLVMVKEHDVKTAIKEMLNEDE